MALPKIYHLPGGNYSSFGFLYERGKIMPVGTSKRHYRGIDLVALNCAICHVGSVRGKPEDPPRYILGMPSNTVDLRAYYEFLFAAAKDAKFSAGLILSTAEEMGIHEDFINRAILQFYAVNLTRTGLLDFESGLREVLKNPKFGPGRIDTFSPAKVLLGFPMDQRMDDAERIGTCDLPSIWSQRQRRNMKLHWDGNNTSVEERNRSAAFGTGAFPVSLDREGMVRIEAFIDEAKPEPYPFPIDSTLAARGKQIYGQLCAYCHGADGKSFGPGQGGVGEVTPIEKIATDRHRLDSYTFALAVNQNLLYAGTKNPGERFSHFRKTYGYANQPLDGIWLRAPYLHNGSVPTLRDLLDPGPNRPPQFYRGDDVYDPVKVGFVSDVSKRGTTEFFPFDTGVAGNGNRGHDGPAYGTTFSAADKSAVVEYLKTF
jgi:cytochrome c5